MVRWPWIKLRGSLVLLAIIIVTAGSVAASVVSAQASSDAATASSLVLTPVTWGGRVSSPADAGIVVTLYERAWIPNGPTQPWVAVATTETASDGSWAMGPYRADGSYYYTFGFKHPSADWTECYWSYSSVLGVLSLNEAASFRPDVRPNTETALRGTGTIRGSVRTADGTPVARASVSLVGGLGAYIATQTATDGSFSLPAVPPGGYVVRAQEYSTGLYQRTYAPAAATQDLATTYTIGAQQTITADIEMRTTTSISGTLQRSDGLPAAKMMVNLFKWNGVSYEQMWQYGVTPKTDRDGRWTFLGQTGGRYKVQFVSSVETCAIDGWYQGASSLESATAFDVEDGVAVSLVDTITLGGELTVYDRYNGSLQAPNWVKLWKWSASAQAWEVARLETYPLYMPLRAIPSGTYRVELLPTGVQWGDHMRTIFYGDTETIESARDVEILPGRLTSIETTSYNIEAVSGSIRSAFTGEMVDGAEVSLWKKSPTGEWSVVATQITDMNSFTMDNLTAGTYRMTVCTPDGSFEDRGYPSGSGLQDAADIVITRGQRLVGIDCQLDPVFGAVEGVVRDFVTQQPIEGVHVQYFVKPRSSDYWEWLSAGPPSNGTAITDAQGRYRIQYERGSVNFAYSDPSGRYTVKAFQRSLGWEDISAGTTVTKDVDLQPRSRYDITVVDSLTAAPLQGMVLSVGGLAPIVTGPDGRYVTPLVDSTWHQIAVTDPTARYFPVSGNPYTWVDPGVVETVTIRMLRNPAVPDIDVKAPTTTSDARVSYPGIGTISLTATDGLGASGVAHTYYVLDGGAQKEGTSLTVSSVGSHRLEFWSADVSGNTETRHVVNFNIAPVAARSLSFRETLQMPAQHWEFDYPLSAAVDEGGTIWVALRDRIRRFGPDGGYAGYDPTHSAYVRRAFDGGVWALSTATSGRIDHLSPAGTVLSSVDVTACTGVPLSIRAVTPVSSGEIYVTDSSGGRVLRFGTDGKLRQVFGLGDRAALLAGAPGRMYAPYGAAVDSSGVVYVAESGQKQIQVFAPDGTVGPMLPCTNLSGVSLAPLDIDYADGELWVNVGSAIWRFSVTGEWLGVRCSDPGATDTTRYQPHPDGSATWTDVRARLVRFVDASGAVTATVGSLVNHVETFWLPAGMAFGPDGRGYVTDGHAHVHMINDAGADLGTFALPVTPMMNAFPKRGAVALDGSGNVFVPDPDSLVAEVNVYSPNGVLQSTVLDGVRAGPGIGFGSNGHLYVTDAAELSVMHLGPDLGYLGRWRSAWDSVKNYIFDQPLATSAAGEVLVGQQLAYSQAAPRVFRYDFDGRLLGELAPAGEQEISGIACAPDGTVFVADAKSARVNYFSASGVYQGSLTGTADMPFVSPRALAFDRYARLWVTDGNGLRCFSIEGLSRTHVLAYVAAPGGSIRGSAVQTVADGASGSLVVAVPDAGYHFVSWSDGALSASRTEANVTNDTTLTATFAQDAVTVRYSAGAGGTITGTVVQTVPSGGSGTVVTAVPNAGHHFVSWSDGVLMAARMDANVTEDKTVTATFVVNTYDLTYSAGPGGSIFGSAVQSVDFGASGAPVNAVPSAGYHFVAWSDGAVSARRTDTNVTRDMALMAYFGVNDPTTRTLSYSASSGGAVTGSAVQIIIAGGSGTAVTAVPATGHHFARWSDGVLTASRTDHNVTVDKAVTAVFEPNTYTLFYASIMGGSISGAAEQTVEHSASGGAVTAVPDPGYRFVQWSDGLTSPTRVETNVTGDKAITAFFELALAVEWQVQYVAGVGGSVSGRVSQSVANGGSASAVTAVTSAGYRFVSWSDGVTTATRTDLVILRDTTVTALFATLPKATVYAPTAPSTMYRGRSASIYGLVTPKHSSGTYLVTLRFYLKNSSGAYVYHHSVSAKRYYYSSSKTKYRAYTSLPHKGRWRVKAVHACGAHAESTSGYDYITVK